jgi:molybdopterin synthase sulfur carrier subunit
VIRVVLPAHLRVLANVAREVQLDLAGVPTVRVMIDALETQYPALRGTIRDPATQERRRFVRFYACELDLSHESLDSPLPDRVIDGEETFFVIGAMAGG